MLRITKTVVEGETRLVLEGRVTKPHVHTLEAACAAEGFYIVLDLSGVTFVDESSADVIGRLRAKGARLHGLSLFVEGLVGRNRRGPEA